MTDDPLARLGSSPASSSPASASPDIRRLVAVAAQRIEEVVDAAEAIAAEIRESARADAERYLEQRRHEAERVAAERRQSIEQASARLRDRLARVESEAAAIFDEAERAFSDTAPAPREEAAAEPRPTPPVESVPEVAPGQSPGEPAEGERPNLGLAYAYEPAEPWSNSSPDPAPSSVEAEAEAYESALIRATQLAVRGNERSQIEGALRDEFGLDDPKPIVDEILGA